MAETYRQFEIPAGDHQITIYYEYGEIVSNDSTIPVRLEPGHTYAFRPNVDKFFVSFGTLSTGKWQAVLVDDTQIRRLPAPPATAPAP